MEVFLLVKDAQIVRLVDRIGEHYRVNIANGFLRPALFQLSMEKQTWDWIETLTEKLEHFRYQGFHLEDLYRQIIAAARLVYLARRELVPNLRNRLSIGGITGMDRVIRDMTVNNFSSNLQLLADLVGELYQSLLKIENARPKNRRPIYRTIPELEDVDRWLFGA